MSLELSGVDLVINGHNHSYERAHPKLASITAGSGGNPRVELSAHPLSFVTIEGGAHVPEAAPWSVTRYLDLSFITVDVTPRVRGSTTMTIRALTPEATVVDAVRLRRRG